jgi:hypothetical protein
MYLNEAHWLIGGDELPGVILNVSITVRLEKISTTLYEGIVGVHTPWFCRDRPPHPPRHQRSVDTAPPQSTQIRGPSSPPPSTAAAMEGHPRCGSTTSNPPRSVPHVPRLHPPCARLHRASSALARTTHADLPVRPQTSPHARLQMDLTRRPRHTRRDLRRALTSAAPYQSY